MTLLYAHHPSPIGPLLLAGDGAVLRYLSFPQGSKAFDAAADWRRDDDAFDDVRSQLDAYFAGALKRFDLPYALEGTPFQKRVWERLATIPYGETTSYGALAKALGVPKAVRAVGAANGANPIPIILPCHRVIGANGALTGFGGGIATKRFLLAHEGEKQLALL